VEYDDGVHQALVAQGVVAVTAAQSFFTRYRSILWIAAGVLVLAWLAAVLRRMVRR
jgi:hypothetical protein